MTGQFCEVLVDGEWTIGIVPRGSSQDLCKSLGIPLDPEGCARTIGRGEANGLRSLQGKQPVLSPQWSGWDPGRDHPDPVRYPVDLGTGPESWGLVIADVRWGKVYPPHYSWRSPVP
ncbi:MAG: acylglycerol kinase family protein [Methanoregula sp.]|nr:acylglycerol kinase family protein [Methanoregula sp.]